MTTLEIIRSMSEADAGAAVEAARCLQAGDDDGAMAALKTMTTNGLTQLEIALVMSLSPKKRDELWDELVACGYIKESNGMKSRG